MSNLAIATNIAGLNAHRSLKVVSDKTEKASERLSSGYKINRAADDAAGLAISEKIRNQIKGLNQANRNVENGISLIQTMDAGMNEIAEMIRRQRELVIQGMNDTNTDSDRQKIHEELNQLSNEITETAEKCEFNTVPLLTCGGRVETYYFTIAKGGAVYNSPGPSVKAGDSFTVEIEDLTVPGGQNTTIGYVQFSHRGYPINSMIKGHTNADPGICEKYEYIGSSVGVSYPGYVNGNYIGGDGGLKVNNVDNGGTWFISIDNIDANDSSQPPVTSYKVTFTFGEGDLGPLYIKSGANESQGTWVDRYDCRAEALGIGYLITTPVSEGERSLRSLDAALETINSNRANAGAQQNRLEHTEKALAISSENLSSSESRIRDTDMAREMMEFTKGNILSQAGMAMLAQANQSPNQVLAIIQG